MQTGIDTLASYRNWRKLYDALPDDRRSPFFSPEYHLAYKEIDPAPAICFWAYRDDENFLFYPFLRKSINALGYDLEGEFFDISGAYNYNGPLGKVSDPGFCVEYNAQLQEFMMAENIVTEFVRYCPVTNNRIFHLYTQQCDVLDNIYVDLQHGYEFMWANSYIQKLRTSIRKGASSGLTSKVFWGREINQDIVDKVYRIYSDTMSRNQADQYYYFGTGFIYQLITQMPQRIMLTVTYYEGLEISFELVIYDGQLSYALMRGTDSNYFRLNPNTFQTNEILRHLILKQIDIYSMGGGASRNDSVYAFKRAFSRTCDNLFYIGTKVHNSNTYETILSQWRLQYPTLAEKYQHRIQCYRLQG